MSEVKERTPAGGFKPTFHDQVQHAKDYQVAKTTGNTAYANQLRNSYRQFSKAKRVTFGLGSDIRKNDGKKFVEHTRTPQFNDLANAAYNDPSGYSIGWYKGQKVMFVSGSRNATDWGLNLSELRVPSFTAKRTIKNLEAIARKHNVDVVLGHSRGARLVAGMRGKYQRAGLDGAMILAPMRDKGMLNIVQSRKYPYLGWGRKTKNAIQPLDRIIGATGRNNYYIPFQGRHAHFYYRDYPGYKPRSYYSRYKPLWGMSNLWKRKGAPWYKRSSYYNRSHYS